MKELIQKFKKAFKGEEIQKYFFNTSWLLSEKVFTLGLSMVTSIFVARYLGPEKFGILSYAVSLVSIFSVATHMGLGGLAIRELVNKKDDTEELMGTFFGIKLFSAVVSGIAFLIFTVATEQFGSAEFWVLVLVSAMILLKPFDVFDFWFQAEVKIKYASIVRSVSKITHSLLKLVFVLIATNLIAFASVHVIEVILVSVLFIYFFERHSSSSIFNWRFSFKRAKSLLNESWMLMLGAIFAILYLKIDQVMLRWMIDDREVGIYSVAVRLSEAWYFIPTAIASSLFPKLVELKAESQRKLNKRFQELFNMLFLIAFGLAIIVTFVSESLINFLYGSEYFESAIILSIHIWAGIFIFMRAAFSKWIIVEEAVVFSLITQGFGALVNIVLNFILIPRYGGLGAAVSTLVAYAVASYLVLLLYKKSRPVFWMMTRAIFSPILIFNRSK